MTQGGIMAHRRAAEDMKAKLYEIQNKYQDAIKRSEGNRIAILKELQSNDDGLEDILLKAIETIYLMTGDEAFYRQAEALLQGKH